VFRNTTDRRLPNLGIVPLVTDAALDAAFSAADLRLAIFADAIEGVRDLLAACRKLVPPSRRRNLISALSYVADESRLVLDHDNVESLLTIYTIVLREMFSKRDRRGRHGGARPHGR